MMWWGVNVGTRAIAEALAPYLDETIVVDQRVRWLWQQNGLRLVAVPVEDLEKLRQKLPQAAGVQRQWLGQIGVWTDVAHGPAWSDLQPVAMDNGRLDLGPGCIRLLMRCWTMPAPESAAGERVVSVMRAELAIQHREQTRADASMLFTEPTQIPGAMEEGLVFNRLALAATMPRGRALLIIPEAADVDWRATLTGDIPADTASMSETFAPPEGEDEPDPGVTQVGQVAREKPTKKPKTRATDTPPGPAGPMDPTQRVIRSLGELMLTPARDRLESAGLNKPITRSIVVLVPRIPDEFTLVPATPAKDR